MRKHLGSRKRIYKFATVTAYLLILSVTFLQANSTRKQAQSHRWKWNGVSRIVAIADIHGDIDAFREILKGTGIVDEEFNWIAGQTHLVQLGDVMDRGNFGPYCFDLLMKLEIQAEEAGGAVHVLIGNHEEANIYGTAPTTSDYVSLSQFWYFLPNDYIKERERPIREKYDGDGYNQEEEAAVMRFWEKVKNDSDDEAVDKYHESFVRQYGEWLITKNVVIKLNDIVFTHGGVDESYSEMGIAKINKLMREDLDKLKFGKPLYNRPRVAYQPNAPQWFRGLIRKEEDSFSDDVDRILANLEANFMVVGHTVRRETRKLDRFGGRIWGIDTGISKFYGGVRCALLIEDGKFRIWWGDEGIEDAGSDTLSAPSHQVQIDQQEMENFLRTATILTAIPDENLGRTEPWIIDLRQGELERQGFFKHVNRCRPSVNADCYKYELAAYELNKLLGLKIVLPVVERVIKARPGSLAMFLPGNLVRLKKFLEGNKALKNHDSFHKNMLDLLVFENLCYTGLIDEEVNKDIFLDPETGYICHIDFSQAFEPKHTLIPDREVTHCSDALWQSLVALQENDIREAMEPYLNDQEIEALIVRKNLLLESLDIQK